MGSSSTLTVDSLPTRKTLRQFQEYRHLFKTEPSPRKCARKPSRKRVCQDSANEEIAIPSIDNNNRDRHHHGTDRSSQGESKVSRPVHDGYQSKFLRSTVRVEGARPKSGLRPRAISNTLIGYSRVTFPVRKCFDRSMNSSHGFSFIDALNLSTVEKIRNALAERQALTVSSRIQRQPSQPMPIRNSPHLLSSSIPPRKSCHLSSTLQTVNSRASPIRQEQWHLPVGVGVGA